ncbi:MAG TPA: glycosyltransferase family 4 protein [Pyrinomonadaceae bacterium]|nr:glycosyltransferase family 4 protein [Pyrinomonadaceae bacterium]
MTTRTVEPAAAPRGVATRDAGAPRVVHLIEALGPGGAERLLYTNLKHFGGRVRGTVFTVFPNATHWAEPIRELGITVESLGCRGPRDLPRGIARLRAWLGANRTDLLHTHLWAANVVGRVAGRLAGVPVLSSVHNPDHEQEAWADGAQVGALKRRMVRAIDRWTAHFGCTRMLAVSEYVRQSAHRHLGFPLSRIELLYNPIDIEALSAPTHRTRAELMGECGVPDESVVLLNVARVSPQKGLLYAIRAMPRVLSRHPSSHLVSVGATTDPQWLEHLRAEAHAAGVAERVHFLGARTDVADFLRACDLFVFPSLYEGLGIALIEAMAAGCACVATESGPIPEVVRDGVDGLLVAPRDADALAATVCALLEDPARRATLGRTARESALTRFEPRSSANKLIGIYQSVIDQAARHETERR